MLPIQVKVLVDDNGPSDGPVGADVLHHDDGRHVGYEMDLAGQSALLRFTRPLGSPWREMLLTLRAPSTAVEGATVVGCYSLIAGIGFPRLLKSRLATACTALSSLLSVISPGGGPSVTIGALIRSGMALLGMVTRHASLELPRDVIGWICTS